MADNYDNNDKLSLHLTSKNVTTLSSGFVDVPAIPTISTKLTLNRQTVVGIGGDGPMGVATNTVGGAGTVHRTTNTLNVSHFHESCAYYYTHCIIYINHPL